MTATTKQKPHKWRAGHDGRCCIECEKPFKRGDMVYQDCVVCLHVACLTAYRLSLIELGLLPTPAQK